MDTRSGCSARGGLLTNTKMVENSIQKFRASNDETCWLIMEYPQIQRIDDRRTVKNELFIIVAVTCEDLYT